MYFVDTFVNLGTYSIKHVFQIIIILLNTFLQTKINFIFYINDFFTYNFLKF